MLAQAIAQMSGRHRGRLRRAGARRGSAPAGGLLAAGAGPPASAVPSPVGACRHLPSAQPALHGAEQVADVDVGQNTCRGTTRGGEHVVDLAVDAPDEADPGGGGRTGEESAHRGTRASRRAHTDRRDRRRDNAAAPAAPAVPTISQGWALAHSPPRPLSRVGRSGTGRDPGPVVAATARRRGGTRSRCATGSVECPRRDRPRCGLPRR